MPKMTTLLVGALLAAWLIASAVRQVKKGSLSWLAPLDRFSLLPIWTFFAPNPGRSDFLLLYRDHTSEGPSPLFSLYTPRNGFSVRGVWNPGKRRSKTLTDMVRALQRASTLRNSDLRLSFPYVVLLSWVSSVPPRSGVLMRDFAILELPGAHCAGSPKIVFLSEAHKIDR